MQTKNELPNIENFHKCVAVVLNKMYENFPNPIDVDTFYIEGDGIPSGKRALVNFNDEMRAWDVPGNSSENNPVKRELAVYKNAIFYLRDEGYIRTDEPKHDDAQRTFTRCRLTSKGLTALGRVGVKERASWGSMIHAAIRDGKYKVLQDLASKVLITSFTATHL
ncbi:hypothetical protein [Paraburkholderia sediminicola]|uniref:hypothetical protein n=1 Tax=Paraburkholderia sediminicola TaxID=458836 RepID=UPI0038B8D98A